MKLSTSHWIQMTDPETGRGYSPLKTMTDLKTAGYDSVDVNLWALCGEGKPLSGDGWERVVEELCAAIDEVQLPAWQTHGDVYSGTEWDDPAFSYRAERHENVLRCIEASRRLGADCMVLHPFNLAHAPLYSKKENRDACIAYLAPYIEAAKRAGVRIAVENMIDFGRRHRRYCAGDVYELIDLVDTINDPAVGICIDTGHANISGMDPAAAIRAAGKRLYAIHVNDNDSKAGMDQHLAPFFGDINWPEVMHALREVGYAGHFTYELKPQRVPGPARAAWLRYTVEIGRYLLSML